MREKNQRHECKWPSNWAVLANH